ncbi:PREDICTED: uncharacterized protein LOC109213071 [Nicotiana attenuata]|uniref:uncharacterized protein LOC109213071 n=1 Tax=Nicotiana attenuata TaxID=49451 RepID=UPI00090572FE|nr:PREDICTED: uncharacterized protein LOC109213071 [Nicotiana attenuata]
MSFIDTLVTGNEANKEPEGSQVTVQTNMVSDIHEDETNNYPNSELFIPITSSDKKRIYKNWSSALIVKIFGRRIGYQFLQKKVHAIWKPTENLSLIDLGCDYYSIKFTKEENYNKALHEGPWFIGNQFLTVRKWEPRFVASKAALTYSAIWARLPELPTEFYDYEILQKIGQKLGQLIRIDASTKSALRGKYARLCVMVPIEQPLKTFIVIVKHIQHYEGFNLLCTNCGRLGHSVSNCPHQAQKPAEEQASSSTSMAKPHMVDTLTQKIDQWAIVSHQKKNKKQDKNPTRNDLDTHKTMTNQKKIITNTQKWQKAETKVEEKPQSVDEESKKPLDNSKKGATITAQQQHTLNPTAQDITPLHPSNIEPNSNTISNPTKPDFERDGRGGRRGRNANGKNSGARSVKIPKNNGIPSKKRKKIHLKLPGGFEEMLNFHKEGEPTEHLPTCGGVSTNNVLPLLDATGNDEERR